MKLSEFIPRDQAIQYAFICILCTFFTWVIFIQAYNYFVGNVYYPYNYQIIFEKLEPNTSKFGYISSTVWFIFSYLTAYLYTRTNRTFQNLSQLTLLLILAVMYWGKSTFILITLLIVFLTIFSAYMGHAHQKTSDVFYTTKQLVLIIKPQLHKVKLLLKSSLNYSVNFWIRYNLINPSLKLASCINALLTFVAFDALVAKENRSSLMHELWQSPALIYMAILFGTLFVTVINRRNYFIQLLWLVFCTILLGWLCYNIPSASHGRYTSTSVGFLLFYVYIFPVISIACGVHGHSMTRDVSHGKARN